MTANEIIVHARSYLGKPYVWGGESMSEGGYDCSGLLYAVLRDCGYSNTRTTASGYSKVGKHIAVGQQKAGDLLFFGKPVTHCAIYIGNGKMIESRGGRTNTKSNPGTGVVISSIYRRSDLTAVRRLWSVHTSALVAGRTYTTTVDHLHVRWSIWGRIKRYSELTTDGMKHAYSDGCLKKGTRVTVQDVEHDENGATWVRIPSGWICAATSNGAVYLK